MQSQATLIDGKRDYIQCWSPATVTSLDLDFLSLIGSSDTGNLFPLTQSNSWHQMWEEHSPVIDTWYAHDLNWYSPRPIYLLHIV